MRQTLGLVVVLLVVLAVRCQPPHGVAEASSGIEPLVGTWSGDWTAGARGRGSMEAIITPTSDPGQVMAQFTFVGGGVTRTSRRVGNVESDGHVRFPLLGGGVIVLRPEGEGRLQGEFTDERGALPAPQGVVTLTRTR